MEDKRFDQWMKDELYDKKSELKQDSWSKMEFMLDSQEELSQNRKFPFMKVAAAILLLVTFSGLGYWGLDYRSGRQDWEHTIGEMKLDEVQKRCFVLEGNMRLPEMELVYEPIVLRQQVVQSPVVVAKRKEEPVIEQDLLVVENITRFEKVDDQMEEELVPVKISYKRSPVYLSDNLIDRSEEDTVRRNRIKEIFNASKEFQAGELWADVRSAKDKILQDPFGINKEQRQKLK
ncbi:MAG: hypothetical protein OCD76_11270 [Reichenbachiella sp.]